jgi:cell division protein FtsI (penicillin-binding protein 3)
MHWGGVLAGPVFKKVMSFVLQSERVQPTTAAKTTFTLTEAALKSSRDNNKKAGA